MNRAAVVPYIRNMRRNALTRISTVLYAVWLVIALGVQTAQPCPAHDGASLAASHAAAGMVMSGVATHLAAAGAHGSRPTSPHDAMHHACTCVGCSCVTALDLATARTVRVPASRIVALAGAARAAACLAPAARAARLLPFANGPPMASSITA